MTIKQFKKKWNAFRRVDVGFIWKQTMKRACPCLSPWTLFISPITVPLLFVLLYYQQYNFGLMIASIQETIELVDVILAKAKAKQEEQTTDGIPH